MEALIVINGPAAHGQEATAPASSTSRCTPATRRLAVPADGSVEAGSVDAVPTPEVLRRTHRRERELQPIVPMVFYQGRRRWRHATEFSELFAPAVRAWPWVPRFEHLLFDQSQVKPRAVRGALRGRITQLMMMAAYRHRREALRSAARLLATFAAGGR